LARLDESIAAFNQRFIFPLPFAMKIIKINLSNQGTIAGEDWLPQGDNPLDLARWGPRPLPAPPPTTPLPTPRINLHYPF
jgi:hypothetical protein